MIIFLPCRFRANFGNFSPTSEEAGKHVRETLDREMLRLRKEDRWGCKLIDLNRFIKRYEDVSPTTSVKNVFQLANNDDNRSEPVH